MILKYLSGYSALSDHPEKGMGGMLWESVICEGDVDRSNCTCPDDGDTRSIENCVQSPECVHAGCSGAISYSTFPLEFPAQEGTEGARSSAPELRF